MDCTEPENQVACKANDVSAYPTIRYFSYGKFQFAYAGGREKADFVAFMSDPQVCRGGLTMEKNKTVAAENWNFILTPVLPTAAATASAATKAMERRSTFSLAPQHTDL